MSEISIQIRRVTQKVEEYYRSFGLRIKSQMRPGLSMIRGTRRLGFDEIECIVAETARGTSVGFYSVNSLQGLLYAIPLLIVLLLHLLNKITAFSGFISGNKGIFGLNLLKLISGDFKLSFISILILLILAFLPFTMEFLHQRIRLANLKARFSFFSRDAIWETREVSPSLISLENSRSIMNHGWLLSILYFFVFSLDPKTFNDLTTLYQTSYDKLYFALSDAFSIIAGLTLGLLASYKALETRKQLSTYDKRNRFSGGILERRIEPIIFGMESALFSIIPFLTLMYITFLTNAPIQIAFQLIIFSLFGAVIAGIIHDEGFLWIISAYAIFLFFSSIALIFRTGAYSGYAYAVMLQLFLIPIPFFIYFSSNFQGILRRFGIESKDWMFDILPFMSFVSIYNINKERKMAKIRYEKSLDEKVEFTQIDNRILIDKDYLIQDSLGYKMARHYYELLLSYTASFEEDKFILIPTPIQLIEWWQKKSNLKGDEDNMSFMNFVDRVLWDPKYIPNQSQIEKFEKVGREMVLAIQ